MDVQSTVHHSNPGGMIGDSFDTVVVHGGLVAEVALQQQSVGTMISLREVVEPNVGNHTNDIVFDGPGPVFGRDRFGSSLATMIEGDCSCATWQLD